MTDITDEEQFRGRLFYDGSCALCRAGVARVRPLLVRCRVEAVPFADGAAEEEMKLLWHDGRLLGGADAALFLAGRLWWARPLFLLGQIPLVRRGLRTLYRQLAARRHCVGGACRIPAPSDRKGSRAARLPLAVGWSLTVVLLVLAWWFAESRFPAPDGTAPWWRMWILASASWLGFKIIAMTRSLRRPSAGFWFWPGMDAQAFSSRPLEEPASPDGTPLAENLGFLLGGIAMLGLACFLAPRNEHPIAMGALTMGALIGILHFGIFALLAQGWNRFGVPVAPLMRRPWLAVGLADFWGARWNRGFSDVARIAVFRPLVRRCGIATGTLAGFLLSGLAHELVISLPARAGWGFPTLYFLIQGLGVLAERRWSLTREPLRRFLTWIVILLPLPLLFHPPFLATVITPFTRTLTSLFGLPS